MLTILFLWILLFLSSIHFLKQLATPYPLLLTPSLSRQIHPLLFFFLIIRNHPILSFFFWLINAVKQMELFFGKKRSFWDLGLFSLSCIKYFVFCFTSIWVSFKRHSNSLMPFFLYLYNRWNHGEPVMNLLLSKLVIRDLD